MAVVATIMATVIASLPMILTFGQISEYRSPPVVIASPHARGKEPSNPLIWIELDESVNAGKDRRREFSQLVKRPSLDLGCQSG
jgi:hypothetical protein